MEQRDYLLRQIQQMAQVLAALIRKLTGLKEESSEDESRMQQTTNEMLKEHFDCDLEDILQVPVDELAAWIVKQKGLHLENVELFSEVLLIHAEAESDQQKKVHMLNMIIEMLSYVDRAGNTFSIERQAKILKLRNEIAEYEG